MKTLALAFTALTTLSLTTRAEVWVVEQTPTAGADFAQIHEAVAAAADGDVILVRTGTFYDGFTIDGKSLSVVALEGAHVPIRSDVVVRNLGAGQSATLHGLFVSAIAGARILTLEDNAGPVFIQDSVFRTNSIMAFGSGFGMQITDTASATFVNSVVSIGYPWQGTQTQDGITVERSFVVFQGGSVDGGHGGLSGIDGGTGIRAIESELTLIDTVVSGGPGGTSFATPCDDGGDGGDGLVVEGGSLVRHLQTTFQGGTGGGGCTVGAPGSGKVVLDGSAAPFPGGVRRLTAGTPVQVGDEHTLEVAGPEGDWVFLFVGNALGISPFFPEFQGALVPALPGVLLTSVGAIGPAGSLSITSTPGPIGLTELELAVQAIVFSPAQGLLLSNGRHVVIYP